MATGTNGLARLARTVVAGAIAILAAFPVAGALVPGRAHAVVGRPLTPVSYAGVARRSSRRVARRTAYRTSAAMSTLPAGCVPYGATYSCGSASYTQVYEGGNVVYVVAE